MTSDGPCTDTCVLEAYEGEESEFYHVVIRKARKPHKCSECDGTIQPKEKYQHYVGKWDGDISTFDTCLLCIEIENKFSCGAGVTFSEMWDGLRENLFYRLTIGCLDGLSPEAKEKVLGEWRKWKGLEV